MLVMPVTHPVINLGCWRQVKYDGCWFLVLYYTLAAGDNLQKVSQGGCVLMLRVILTNARAVGWWPLRLYLIFKYGQIQYPVIIWDSICRPFMWHYHIGLNTLTIKEAVVNAACHIKHWSCFGCWQWRLYLIFNYYKIQYTVINCDDRCMPFMWHYQIGINTLTIKEAAG